MLAPPARVARVNVQICCAAGTALAPANDTPLVPQAAAVRNGLHPAALTARTVYKLPLVSGGGPAGGGGGEATGVVPARQTTLVHFNAQLHTDAAH